MIGIGLIVGDGIYIEKMTYEVVRHATHRKLESKNTKTLASGVLVVQ